MKGKIWMVPPESLSLYMREAPLRESEEAATEREQNSGGSSSGDIVGTRNPKPDGFLQASPRISKRVNGSLNFSPLLT